MTAYVKLYPVYRSPKLTDNFHDYDGASVISRDPQIAIYTTSAGLLVRSRTRVFAGMTPKKDWLWLQSAGATGVGTGEIDCSRHKAYIVVCTAPADSGIRFNLAVFGAEHQIINSAVVPTTVASEEVSLVSATFNGKWGTTTDNIRGKMFRLAAEAKTFIPFFTGGTAAALIGNFSIFAVDANVEADFFVGGDPQLGTIPKILASANPSKYGLFGQGDHVHKGVPTGAADGILSVCTVSGRKAPAHPASGAVLQYDYTSNVGNVYWCSFPGTLAGAAPTGTDPAATYTDGTALFRYERPFATLV